MNLVMTRFQIDGLSPLLQNNPASMAKVSAGPKTKKIPTPEDEARSKLYLTKDKKCFLPTTAFRSSLLAACVGKKFGKATAWKIMSAAVMMFSEETILTDEKGKEYVENGVKAKNYTVDYRRVVIQRAAIMRARPRFEDWHCVVAFSVDTDLIEDLGIVETLLNEAGTTVGVGDFRVANKGVFGRYTAKLIKEK